MKNVRMFEVREKQLSLSILTTYVPLPRFTLGNLFEFVFHNSAWNSFHLIYLYILKSVKIFKQRTNWKKLFIAHATNTTPHLILQVY